MMMRFYRIWYLNPWLYRLTENTFASFWHNCPDDDIVGAIVINKKNSRTGRVVHVYFFIVCSSLIVCICHRFLIRASFGISQGNMVLILSPGLSFAIPICLGFFGLCIVTIPSNSFLQKLSQAGMSTICSPKLCSRGSFLQYPIQVRPICRLYFVIADRMCSLDS